MNFIIRGRGINACFLIVYEGTVDYSCSKDIAPTPAPPESTPSNLSLFDRKSQLSTSDFFSYYLDVIEFEIEFSFLIFLSLNQ